MPKKPKAYIRPARGNGLWLLIDPMGVTEVNGYILPHKDMIWPEEARKVLTVAYPIMHEEVETIRDACNEYLKAIEERGEI